MVRMGMHGPHPNGNLMPDILLNNQVLVNGVAIAVVMRVEIETIAR